MVAEVCGETYSKKNIKEIVMKQNNDHRRKTHTHTQIKENAERDKHIKE